MPNSKTTNDDDIARNASPADASADNWVDHYAPASTRPYLRLMRADRPIGTWLLLIPCWQGLAYSFLDGSAALPIGQALFFAVLFSIGAFVMRGAGCAYNDIVDRDFDAKVARTALRPIPAGQVSVKRAYGFMIGLCLIGLVVLLQFNWLTIALGVGSLFLVASYPFMKRITWWPQAWLGLTFNWGALIGYSAASGALSLGIILIYLAGLLWTLGYDTIYAHQDKDDDALIGVKSSARALGDHTRPAVLGFYAMVIALFAVAGGRAGAAPVYYCALLPAAGHFLWQWRRLDTADSDNCLRLFKSNREAGLLLLAALLIALI